VFFATITAWIRSSIGHGSYATHLPIDTHNHPLSTADNQDLVGFKRAINTA